MLSEAAAGNKTMGRHEMARFRHSRWNVNVLVHARSKQLCSAAEDRCVLELVTAANWVGL
jgi:hypothetical protein